MIEQLKNLQQKISEAMALLKLPDLKNKMAQLAEMMNASNFWADQKTAKTVSQDYQDLKSEIDKWEDLEKRVVTIEKRNSKVELDKAWETSWTRRVFIALVTYVIAGIWLVLIEDSYPWLKAFVPTVGYVLSTLSIPFVKRWWAGRRSA